MTTDTSTAERRSRWTAPLKVRISEEQHARLTHRAEEEQTTVSALVRLAVVRALADGEVQA